MEDADAGTSLPSGPAEPPAESMRATDGGAKDSNSKPFAEIPPAADTPKRPPGLRPGIYSRWVLILVVAAFGAAIVWGQRNNGRQIPVLIARSDLPAYHAVTPDDVMIGLLRTGDKDRYAAMPIDGRVTLQEIKKDAPITRDAIGPDPARILKSKVTVVGVNVTRAALLGGAVRSGERVRLVATGRNGRSRNFDAVVLSYVKGSAGARDWALVVAVKASDGRRVASLPATANFVILRDPEMTTPG
jgi:hypothetical protein